MALTGPVGIAFNVHVILEGDPGVSGSESLSCRSSDLNRRGGQNLLLVVDSLVPFTHSNYSTPQNVSVISNIPGSYYVDYELTCNWSDRKRVGTFIVSFTEPPPPPPPDKINGDMCGIRYSSPVTFTIDNGNMSVNHISVGALDDGITILGGSGGLTRALITRPDSSSYVDSNSGYLYINTASQSGLWAIKWLDEFSYRVRDKVFGPDMGPQPEFDYKLYKGNGIGGVLLDAKTTVGMQNIYHDVWVDVPDPLGYGADPFPFKCGFFGGQILDAKTGGYSLENTRITGGYAAGPAYVSGSLSICLNGEGYVFGVADIVMSGHIVGAFTGTIN